MVHKNKKGFTLIEMLVVIAILAGLAALVIPMIGGVREEAAITTTLNEMKTIKEAIRDRFYPDLGLIPEDTDHPKYAIRYLCLKNDGGTGNPEYDEMRTFVGSDNLMTWDRYSRRGWQGQYMEREATAWDDNETPSDSTDDEWHPVLADAWFNGNEPETEKEKHYYRIFGGQTRNLAQIVCYGENGKADCDVVIGTDGNNYVCIQEHSPVAADNRPVIGTDWANFWALDNTQTGSTWVNTTDYNSFGSDDLTMHIFGAEPIQSP